MAVNKELQYLRNIGIMAHIDAGKTTTSERICIIPGKPIKLGKYTTVPPRWTGWSRSRSGYHHYFGCNYHILELPYGHQG